MNRREAGADSTSPTSAGSAKLVWGSLSDQHPFPEGTFFLVQLTKVVYLCHILPPPETLTDGPARSFCVQGSSSVLLGSLSEETQFLSVFFISLINGILLYC